MKTNNIFQRIASLFTVFLTIVGIYGTPALATKSGDALVVYYFHGNVRCPSCLLLEELTRSTVEFYLGEEMKTGRISLKIINTDKPDNAHFTEDYDLSVQSVVLSQVQNGGEKSWKKLDRLWELLHDEEVLVEYMKGEIRQSLGK